MSMTAPTDIAHARAFKAMGVPLNTVVIEKEFSAKATKLWVAAYSAHVQFCSRLIEYANGPDTIAYAKLKRAHLKIEKAGVALQAYALELDRAGDEGQAAALRALALDRVGPFVAGWDDIFAQIEAGETVTIPPMNSWSWKPGE